MSDYFGGGPYVGVIFVVLASICIFGRNALIANHIKWNEKMLARWREDASLDQTCGVLVGILSMGMGILAAHDNADEGPQRLWIALPMGAFGLVCFVAARYLVPIQSAHVRWLHRPLARQIASILIILLGGFTGWVGFLILRDSFLMFFKK